ncbi:hypothetical protein, partial [Escherichia coli]|uniref:hypothetical protein n=1 Tax=Escherichia coli TaxID=562 RepID=UPI001B7D8D89
PKTSIICSPMTSLKTSIKTITYLSDTGCLEIQGASLNSKPLYFYCNKIWLIYKLHWGKKLSGMFLRSKASSRIAFAKTQERSPPSSVLLTL